MNICKELKFFSMETIIDIISISIIGTILHFAFEASGGNLLVAMFSAVNNSIWEHIKIAIIAIYIVTIAKMMVLEKREYNLWTSLFYKIITVIILVPLLFYGYKEIFIVENLVVDILILYIAIIISRIIEVNIQKRFRLSSKIEEVYMYLNIGIFVFFVIFTFFPLKLDIFRDRINNKYGI